jgi:hypothetical protein
MERKMKLTTILSAGCVIAVLGSYANQASAQLAPGTFADGAHPSGPPDPTKLDAIWQVDPLTGALTVKIPFPTTPTGGRGPTIPFALSYNSASTVTLQTLGTYVSGFGATSGPVTCDCSARCLSFSQP